MADSPLSRWLREEMPKQGYPLEGPRAGGTSRLADDAGISRAAMSRIINGQGDPTPDSLRRIGNVLGYNLGEMMVIAGLADQDEISVRDRPPTPEPIAVSPNEVSFEDLLGDLDDYERRIAAIQNAPFEQRLKAILIYRQVVEAGAQNAGRPAVEQADRGRRSSRGA